MFEKETQLTYYENEGPLFWLHPDTGPYPFAGIEELCEGFEDRRVLNVAKKYNSMVFLGIVHGDPLDIPSPTIHLNDLYMDPEANAFTRSVYLTNLPKPQPESVTVAKLYQANSRESFNQYLAQFKKEGWLGAWVRPNDSIWTDTEFFVKEPL
jgi:hypothetical protein